MAEGGSRPAPVVVKIGGGLLDSAGALERVCAAVERLARRRATVVVPGGGPFADAVREFDARHRLSPDAAHWMAILAMDQYAHVLVAYIPGAVLVEDAAMAHEASARRMAAVLAPFHWMRAADVLPHSWAASSDSVAAFVAGALDAERLVLVKPAGASGREALDAAFPSVIPAGLPWLAIGWDQIEELDRL